MIWSYGGGRQQPEQKVRRAFREAGESIDDVWRIDVQPSGTRRRVRQTAERQRQVSTANARQRKDWMIEGT